MNYFDESNILQIFVSKRENIRKSVEHENINMIDVALNYNLICLHVKRDKKVEFKRKVLDDNGTFFLLLLKGAMY